MEQGPGASASRSESEDDDVVSRSRPSNCHKEEVSTKSMSVAIAAVKAISAKVKSLKLNEAGIKVVGGSVDSSTEASEVIDTSDSIPVRLVRSRNPEFPVLNPLELSEVISHLFLFIGVMRLKEMRLVCRQWNEIACSQLRKRAAIRLVADNLEMKTAVNITMDYMQQNSVRRFETYKLLGVKVTFDITRLGNFTRLMGMHLKVLTLSSRSFNVHGLKYVLVSFPNLEELHIYCPANDFMSGAASLCVSECKFKLKILGVSGESGVNPNIIAEIFNSCSDLKSFVAHGFLSADCWNGHPFVTELFMLASIGKINLSNLEVLQIGGKRSLVITTYAILSLGLGSHPLNLTHLEITVSYELDPIAFTALLEAVGHSLRELICHMDPPSLGFQVLIPTTMTKLLKLEILTGNIAMCIGPLVSACHLPNLQHLNLFRSPEYLELKVAGMPDPLKSLVIGKVQEMGMHLDFDLCWNTDKSKLIKGCRNYSLHTLSLPFGFTRPKMFAEIYTAFPNLVDLRLHDPSCEVIQAVFTLCSAKLERFSLRMISFPKHIDSILTGLKKSWCQTMVKNQKFKFASPAEVVHQNLGLRDMINLKYFELRQCLVPLLPMNLMTQSYLSEVTLYHGLIYLSRAVQIDLQGCEEFSHASVRELRAKLSPTCHVNIIDKPSGETEFWSAYGSRKSKPMNTMNLFL